MDSWSPEQLGLMKCGGNKQCVKFLKQHGLRRYHTIAERYDCAAAMWYQQILKARRDGEEEPKEMPDYTPTKKRATRESIIGFGRDNMNATLTSSTRSTSNSNISDGGSVFSGSASLNGSIHSESASQESSSIPPTPRTSLTSLQVKGSRVERDLEKKGKELEAAVLDKATALFKRISLFGSSRTGGETQPATTAEVVKEEEDANDTATAVIKEEGENNKDTTTALVAAENEEAETPPTTAETLEESSTSEKDSGLVRKPSLVSV